MTHKGMEELTDTVCQIGNYLQRNPNNRYLNLRGKYQGKYLEDIPRGYIRNVILTQWLDDLTEDEVNVYRKYSTQEKNMTKKDPIDEAFENIEKTGFAQIPLERNTPAKKIKPEKIKTEATDEELEESEAVIDAIIEEEEKTDANIQR